MKKLILLAVLALPLAVLAQGQGPEPIFTSISLLNPSFKSLTTTNLAGATNLTFVDGTLTTNNTGLSWTNSYNQKFTVTASAYTNVNPFVQVPLYSLRGGDGPWIANTNTVEGIQKSFANISVTITGGSGANVANSIVIAPVYDGDFNGTATGDYFTFAVTPAGATTVTISTNVPLWKWPGAAAITVRDITPGDTDASSQVTYKALRLNSWRPK